MHSEGWALEGRLACRRKAGRWKADRSLACRWKAGRWKLASLALTDSQAPLRAELRLQPSHLPLQRLLGVSLVLQSLQREHSEPRRRYATDGSSVLLLEA